MSSNVSEVPLWISALSRILNCSAAAGDLSPVSTCTSTGTRSGSRGLFLLSGAPLPHLPECLQSHTGPVIWANLRTGSRAQQQDGVQQLEQPAGKNLHLEPGSRSAAACSLFFFLFSVTWQLKASKDPFNLGDVRSATLCFAAGFGLSNALRSKEAPTRKGEPVFLLVLLQHSSLKTWVCRRWRC